MSKPGSLKEAIDAANRSIRCIQKGHHPGRMKVHRDGTHVSVEMIKDPNCDCDKEKSGL